MSDKYLNEAIIGNKNILNYMINNNDNKKRNTGLAYKLINI